MNPRTAGQLVVWKHKKVAPTGIGATFLELAKDARE